MKILVTRHGQTDWNVEKRIQGRTDVDTYFNGIPKDNNIINLGIENCEIVKYNLVKDNKFIIYAHRGASAYAPENTRVAFKKAIELNANGIELDLQKTKFQIS